MITLGLFIIGLGLIIIGWIGEDRSKDMVSAGASVVTIVIGVWAVIIAGLFWIGGMIWG